MSSSHGGRLSFPAKARGVKKRRVRKGTKNCWECKRRKVRCIFASSDAQVCDNCKKRGTSCISQEYEDAPLPNHERSSESRATFAGQGDSNTYATLTPPDDFDELHPTPLSADEEVQSLSQRPTSIGSATIQPLPTKAYTRATNERNTKFDASVRDLLDVWPGKEDLDRICTLPVGLSAYSHRAICSPYSSTMYQEPTSPQETLRLPPPGSHPVLFARKLLMLGTFLQGVLPSSIEKMGALAHTYRRLMTDAIDRAVKLVTTNDELYTSVEGVECILLEANYHNYGGSLHKAWLATRRAIAVAQLIGLHRGSNAPPPKMVQPENRATVDMAHLNFRLVEMDGYLSLMLGLPPSSLDSSFATDEALAGVQPIDRLQRVHVAVGRRILQSGGVDVKSFETVKDIDSQLQKAAAEMSPQWWLPPNFLPNHSDGAALLHDTTRLMNQFAHYHLLTRLHLPYMMRFSSDHRYDYSKITAITSSREVLSRYVAFRVSNPAHFYCRGSDFLAFIACTVLCLAHIQSNGQCQQLAGAQNSSAVGGFLAHCRPSDRGTMERTLEIIQDMTKNGDDGIASKLARSIHNLLTIETHAANGAQYSTTSSKDGGDLLDNSQMTSKGLYVRIPYFGTIKFEKGIISREPPMATLRTSLSGRGDSNNLGPREVPDAAPGTAIFDPQSSYQIGMCLHNLPPQLGASSISAQPSSIPQPPVLNESIPFSDGQLPSSMHMDFGITDEEWDLQGVDVTLFDSLFRGIEGDTFMDDLYQP